MAEGDITSAISSGAAAGSGAAAVPAPVAVDETDRLIASDRIAGTEVFGRDGRRLGTVHNFMVDKVTGRVAYAVMAFGGFLGLGERLHPLPWEALTYDPARGGYVVDLDRAGLDAGPGAAGR